MIQKLRGLLTPKTFAHSLAVRDRARELAADFGADPARAALAGLLHDCAKNLPADAYLGEAAALGLEVYGAERRSPKVLHQRVGAAWAARDFGVDDESVCRAICCHTTGRHDMDALARCVFVADYTSADRDYPGVDRLRAACDRGADDAFRSVLLFKRTYVRQAGLPEHPWAENAYRKYL